MKEHIIGYKRTCYSYSYAYGVLSERFFIILSSKVTATTVIRRNTPKTKYGWVQYLVVRSSNMIKKDSPNYGRSIFTIL